MNPVVHPRFSPLALILLVALAHGLLYVFLVPPWQHYDEPTHFEYVWLSAHRALIPSQTDIDKEMRLNVARSMVAHGFFRDLPYSPDLQADAFQNIGFAQVGYHPPLYYILAGLPLRMFPENDVDTQLYAARLVSLLLYLLSVVAAYGCVRLLVPEGHVLRWLVPLTISLLPGYVDLMTSVNNDVGATAFFSVFLWACLSVMVTPQPRAARALGIIALVAAAFMCYYVKRTVAIALPVGIPALLFGVLQGPWRRLAWWAIGASVLVVGVLTFGWGDAAFWYRHTSQPEGTRCAGAECRASTPVGDYAIQLDVEPAAEPPEIAQPLLLGDDPKLAGQTVTVGSWMWATDSITVAAPVLVVGQQFPSPQVAIGPTPRFVAYSVRLAKDISPAHITLAPLTRVTDQPVRIFYTGLVLTNGARPSQVAPHFADAQAQGGDWGGVPFQNWVRDGSAQLSWPYVRSWLNRFDNIIWEGRTTDTFSSLLDPQVMGWYYQQTVTTLFETFWARFGWGHVFLPDAVYALLALTTGVSIAAALIALADRARRLRWDALFILSSAFALLWSLTILRGAGQTIWDDPYIPVARYAEPAIIPTSILLSVGWFSIARLARAHAAAVWQAFALLWLALDAFALWSLVRFYAR